MQRAIIYEFHGAHPAPDRFTHSSATEELTIVLVGDPSRIPAVATELAGAGVELIELCGGVPLAIRAKVKAAVGSETRVASVMFGIESLVKAAEFNHAFMAGNPPAEACILLVSGADPARDRFVRSSETQNTSFVMSDERSAVNAGRELADRGVGLIELYGGFPDDIASEVIDAVSGRAAVGVSGPCINGNGRS